MNCCELIGFLDEYLAGGLSAEARATFERHLGLCPPCCDYLETYKQTIFLAKRAAKDAPKPEPLPETLVKAILAACPSKKS